MSQRAAPPGSRLSIPSVDRAANQCEASRTNTASPKMDRGLLTDLVLDVTEGDNPVRYSARPQTWELAHAPGAKKKSATNETSQQNRPRIFRLQCFRIGQASARSEATPMQPLCHGPLQPLSRILHRIQQYPSTPEA